MRSPPNPGGSKPPRRRLFRVFDTNSRDGISQRHGRVVHIPFIAVPGWRPLKWCSRSWPVCAPGSPPRCPWWTARAP